MNLATSHSVDASYIVLKLSDFWCCLAGAGTALLGKEAAMACTVAVEEVISEHYDKWAIQNSFYWTQKLFYKIIFLYIYKYKMSHSFS